MRGNDAQAAQSVNTTPLVFKTGGLVMFVGVWFLLLGVALTSGAVFLAALPAEDGPGLWLRVLLVVMAAVPLAFAVLGVLLTFGGEHITLDGVQRQVRIRHGRWWTWKRVSRAFDEFYAVELHRQHTRIGVEHDGGPPTYPVRLLSGGDEVELASMRNERKAREIAERVARHTGLPLHDAREREKTVRAADALDESLAERARRLGEDVSWPRLPRNSRIDVHYYGDETYVDLPRPSRKMVIEGILGLVFLLAIYGGALGGLAYGLRNVLRDVGVFSDGGLAAAAVWAVPLIPVVYILVFGLVLLLARERVVVSPRLVKRVWQLPIGAWTRRIPAGEVEELVDRHNDVLVRTDRGEYKIGFTLGKGERRWLRAALRYLLVKGGAGGAVVSELGER